MGNKALDCTALTVSLIGAINWGLVGFFNFFLDYQGHLCAGRAVRPVSDYILFTYRTGSITGYSKGRNLRTPDCEDKPAHPGSCFRYGVMDRIRAQVL